MKKHRYPGIHSFTDAERGEFFGRERETKELYRLLLLNPVLVLFGKSGTGKTSLLQAGVAPLLHERLLEPLKLRLNDTAKPIRRQLWEQFNSGDCLPVDTPDNLTLTELCARFDSSLGGEALSPVLLLDQFEELFTLYPDHSEQRADFIAQLAELLHRQDESAPRVRVVISIRADFLYLLDRLSARIPAIMRCRYELRALDEDNARRAITLPATLAGDYASQPFAFSPEALETALDGLSGQREAGAGGGREVEAFLLQQFCRRLEQQLIGAQAPAGFSVTPAYFGGAQGISGMLDEFYAEVLAKFPDPAARRRVQQLVEEKLISGERRIIGERDALCHELRLNPADLDLLATERLLRQEPRGGALYYEISHDTLLGPVLKSKKKRQAEEEERKRAEELAAEEARLAEERAAAERRAREAEEKAAEERRRAEAAEQLQKEAENQRAIAQKSEARARIVTLIALLLALFAGWSYWKAEQQKNIAETKTKETAAALKKVEQEKAATERQRSIAETKTREAESNLQLADENLKKAQVEEARAKAAQRQADNKTQEVLEQKERADKALKDIREKNRVSFEAFASLGARLVYTLDHAEALEKMKTAVDIEVETDLKRKQLTEPLCELIYFFAESGRRPELARTAAELLLQLDADAAFVPLLRQCTAAGWTTRSQFKPLLEKLPFFQKFQARYYPELVNVPLGADGIFEMGSDLSEWGHQSDEQVHQVKLSAYQISATPVTFYQFALYCEAADRGLASRTPYWGRFGDHPVVSVNWYEAAEYANWLNAQQGLPPAYQIQKEVNSDPDNQVRNDFLKWKVDWDTKVKGFRLPTEAEWELAARAGVGAPKTLFAGSDTLDSVGWYRENSGDKPLSGNWDLNRIYDNNGRTHPVRQKKANGIGVHDMSGNVYEWCWDWYDSGYYDECEACGIEKNPSGSKSSSDGRVVRGGSWRYDPGNCRVAHRYRISPGDRSRTVGFRLVFVP